MLQSSKGRLVCIVPLILLTFFGLRAQPAGGDAAIRDRVRQLIGEIERLGEFEIEGGVKVLIRVPTPSEAIVEFREMGEPAVDALHELLVNCAGSYRRRLVVDTLGRIGTRKATEPLAVAAQTDPDPGIREIALIWLVDIAWDKAEPVLRSVKQHDPVKRLREQAGRLLESHGTLR